MGAGASFNVAAEMILPTDGSDLTDAAAAKAEVIRLRTLLQAYVEDKGGWPLDASDILTGTDEEDYTVCLREVCNIRAAIHLQGSDAERAARGGASNRDARRASMMADQRAAMMAADAAAGARTSSEEEESEAEDDAGEAGEGAGALEAKAD
jgi:hypothetical protein